MNTLEQTNIDVFERAMVELIRGHRFYAEFIQRMKKTYTNEIPTLGVCPTENGFSLYINKKFFSELSIEEQIDILRHEAHHCLNLHFDREKVLEPDLDRKAANKKGTLKDKIKAMFNAKRLNIAEDAAINEYLPNIPKKMKFFDEQGNVVVDDKGNPMEGEPVTVEGLKQQYKVPMENKQAFEYYYYILKEEDKKNHGDMGGDMSGVKMVVIDDHSMMEEGIEKLGQDFVKEMAKNLANQAAEATREAGTIPGEVQGLIDKLNYKHKDWRQDLRKFISKAYDSVIEISKKKRNRRYGMQYPGHIRYPLLHLAVIADSSGSVSDEEYTQFMAELDGINNAGAKITFIECDATVQYVGKFDPKKKLQVKGRGGTMMKPAFDLIKTKDFIKKYGDYDGIILLTDAGIFDVKEIQKPKVPFLIAIIGQEKNPFPWGMETRVKINKKG